MKILIHEEKLRVYIQARPLGVKVTGYGHGAPQCSLGLRATGHAAGHVAMVTVIYSCLAVSF